MRTNIEKDFSHPTTHQFLFFPLHAKQNILRVLAGIYVGFLVLSMGCLWQGKKQRRMEKLRLEEEARLAAS